LKNAIQNDDYHLPNIPLLKYQEERELLRKAQAAARELEKPVLLRDQKILKEGKEAKDHLVLANHRLVRQVAYHFQNRGLPYSDLVAEGLVGLMRAIDKFDLTRETRLSTYATWWIRQTLQVAVRNTARLVRIPNHLVDLGVKCRIVMDNHYSQTGEELSYEEALKKLGKKSKTLAENLRYAERAANCTPFQMVDKEVECQIDTMPDKRTQNPTEEVETTEEYEGLISLVKEACGERYSEALLMHFGVGCSGNRTLKEIGFELGGVSRERARQLKEKALTLVKEAVRKKHIYSGHEGKR
jgi:RNA polymerase primary sigma factor